MMKSATAATAVLVLGSAAVAVPASFSDEQSITSTGQSFTFEFTNIPAAIGSGTLLVEALGDYSIVPPSAETFGWDIEGIASGQGFNAGAFADPDNVDLFQNAVSQEFPLTAADLASITADGTITINAQNSSSVNFFTDQPEDFVRVTISYDAVPAPGAMGLLGVAGLAATRRRR